VSDELIRRAATLRSNFDRGFAQPPPAAATATEAMLAIGVGDAAYALRISEIAGLVGDRSLTAVPSPIAALRGLVGLRGEMIAVYDLGALLGHGRSAQPLRWLAVCGGAAQLAVAFERLDGYFHVPSVQVHTTSAAEDDHLREVVHADCATRAVVSIPALVTTITRLCGSSTSKEP